jgi:hypothetical protein
MINETDTKLIIPAVWTLSNLLFGSPNARYLSVANGIVSILCDLLLVMKAHPNATTDFHLLRAVIWAFLNLTGPTPTYLTIRNAKTILQIVLSTIQGNYPVEIISDSCWIIINLAENFTAIIQSMIDFNTVPILVEILHKFRGNRLMVASVLRVFGCIAMGSNRQTEALLNDKVLPIFGFLLKFPGSETILHDLCWILSNIATGPVTHKETLLQTNMLPKIIELSRTENLALKKQVISIIRKLAWTETDNTDSTKESFPQPGLDIRVDILILKALNRFSTQGRNKKYIEICIDALVLNDII